MKKIEVKDVIKDPCKDCEREHDWAYMCDITCGKRTRYLSELAGAKKMLEALSGKSGIHKEA